MRGDLAAVLTAAILQGRYGEVREIPRAWVRHRDDLRWVWRSAEAVESSEPELLLRWAIDQGLMSEERWEAEGQLSSLPLPKDLSPLIEAFRGESVERLAQEIAPGKGLAALEELQELALAGQKERRGVTLGESLEAATTALSEGEAPFVPTGLGGIDTEVQLRPGNVYYLGGHTGHGKSSLALQWAIHAAREGYAVRFFSFEMLHEEISMRALAQTSGVPESRLREHLAGEWELDELTGAQVRRAWRELSELPLVIDDYPGGDLDEVVANMARSPADLYVVDHMHLMTHSAAETRQLEVAGISRRLKLFSVEHRVPVLALVQFKQPDTRRTGTIPPPTLGSIRDSGAPAQDASGVFLLHQHRDAEDILERTTLTVAKNRGGRFPVTWELDFDGPTYSFQESERF